MAQKNPAGVDKVERKSPRGSDLLKAFKSFDLGRKKFAVLTGWDYRKFSYVMKFYDKHKRITPAQERELRTLLERLKQVEDYEVGPLVELLEEFLKVAEVKAEGKRGL